MYGEMTKKANKSDRYIRKGGRMSARKEGGRRYGRCSRVWLKEWQRMSREIRGVASG